MLQFKHPRHIFLIEKKIGFNKIKKIGTDLINIKILKVRNSTPNRHTDGFIFFNILLHIKT